MAPSTRSGSGDDCIVDADCAVAGEVCQQSNNVLFYPADLCGDGAGGGYLLSNDGAVTDPSPSSTDAERSEVVMRLTLDSREHHQPRADLSYDERHQLHRLRSDPRERRRAGLLGRGSPASRHGELLSQ